MDAIKHEVGILHIRLLTDDGSETKTETSQSIWGLTKFEIIILFDAIAYLF
jgi:hypothetical protein